MSLPGAEKTMTDISPRIGTECGNGYYIRLATLADVSAIGEIEIEAGSRFRSTGLLDRLFDDSGEKKITSFDRKKLSALVEKAQVWVACDDHQPVGFAICAIFGRSAFLEEIDVLSTHGRQGLATKLIEHACRWAVENGLAYMDLCTFEAVPWNGPFYRKLGFVNLPQTQWYPEVLAELKMEEEAGLPMETRVVMRLQLAHSQN
jgi:GNAT superfamily N-acetyltransferase